MDVERAKQTLEHSFDDLDGKLVGIHASIRQITWIIVAQCLLILVGMAGMLSSLAT